MAAFLAIVLAVATGLVAAAPREPALPVGVHLHLSHGNTVLALWFVLRVSRLE